MIIIDFLQTRPLSWSAISSFEYDPEEWYKRYILNEKQPENRAMLFGKEFARSCEERKPLAPVTLYSQVEYPLKVVYNGIPLIGFIDTYEPHTKLGEFKTSAKPWTQEKVDNHGQLKMYAMMLYIQHKVKPEDLHIQLQNVLTTEGGDFSVSLAEPKTVFTFETKCTMIDLLYFGQRINKTIEEMQKYVDSKLAVS